MLLSAAQRLLLLKRGVLLCVPDEMFPFGEWAGFRRKPFDILQQCRPSAHRDMASRKREGSVNSRRAIVAAS